MAPAARFNAASQRSKFKVQCAKGAVQCCFAAVQEVQKLLRSVQSSMRLRRGSSGSMLLRSGSSGSKAATQRSKFKEKPKGLTRCEAALPAALLPYTPKALHAP
jgi:hypothetical protein